MNDAEATARSRFMVLNAVRIGALVMVMLGIAIVQEAIDLPYALGVVLAVAGLVEFLFVPPLLATRWQASEKDQG